MTEDKTPRRVGVYLDLATIKLVDAWRAEHRPIPSFSSAVRMMIRESHDKLVVMPSHAVSTASSRALPR